MVYLKKVVDFILTKKVLGTFLVIVCAMFLVKLIRNIISRILINDKNDYEIKRRKTIIDLIQSVIKYIIYIIAIVIILDFYGVNTTSLITSLGVVGAVLGLAFQDTMKDFISGISLILENYLAVGDIVTFKDFTGEVIELGLRVTKIKAFSGEVLIVANRNIDSIINASQKKADIYINIDTAYEEKTEKVETILKKVVEDAIKDKLILKESSYLGINELSTSSIKYTIDVRCNQDKRYDVKREMLKRIKLAYEKSDIKIPYNQIEVHHGQKL